MNIWHLFLWSEIRLVKSGIQFFFTLKSLVLHINPNLKQLVEYWKVDCHSDLFAKFLSEQEYTVIISQSNLEATEK